MTGIEDVRIMIIFNIWFYLLSIVYTAAAILLFFPYVAFFRIFISHRRALKTFRRSISISGKGIIYLLVYPYIRVKYRDLTNADEEGPFVFVCNHRSSSDPFLMACLPGEIVQVVNIWPFRLPVLGVTARLAGYLSVREMPFEEFMLKAKTLLEQGVSIAAFPEGTRSGTKAVGNFHGAIFRVCLETGVSIVPVCIMGNEDKPPRSSLMLRPGVIKVHRLPSLTMENYKDMSPFKMKNTVRRVIMDHIEREEGGSNEVK